MGNPSPTWAWTNENIKSTALENIPEKALFSSTKQYIQKLQELRAGACELLVEPGEKFLDEVFICGKTGVRSISNVVKERELEDGGTLGVASSGWVFA